MVYIVLDLHSELIFVIYQCFVSLQPFKYGLFNYQLTSNSSNLSILLVLLCRCVVPECEAANSSEYAPGWLAAALPAGTIEARCSRRAPIDSQLPCQEGTAFSHEVTACDRWLYQANNTIVSEVIYYL